MQCKFYSLFGPPCWLPQCSWAATPHNKQFLTYWQTFMKYIVVVGVILRSCSTTDTTFHTVAFSSWQTDWLAQLTGSRLVRQHTTNNGWQTSLDGGWWGCDGRQLPGWTSTYQPCPAYHPCLLSSSAEAEPAAAGRYESRSDWLKLNLAWTDKEQTSTWFGNWPSLPINLHLQ